MAKGQAKKIANQLRNGATLLLALYVLSGCNTTKYLNPDQELLSSQRIELEDRRRVSNRADVAYELSTIAKQQPNDNFLGIWPREYFYLDNNKPRDSTAIDRFLRNTIGQEPTIYSDSLSRRSAAAMQDYLRYKGYFDARAYHEPKRGKRNKVDLIYHIEAGRRWLIDSVAYTSPDPELDSLLRVAQVESELQPGEPLDLNNFDLEKARVGEFLRNRGYAFFSGAYIDALEVDTSRRSGYADVFFSILPPQSEDVYSQFTVGEIVVYSDYNPLALSDQSYRLDTVLDGVRFVSNAESFRIRPEILRGNVYLRPGEVHRRADLDKTNLALNQLGIYRFVRINQQLDSSGNNVIDYAIQLRPGNRMSVGVDLDLNYTNRNGTAGPGNLIGIAVEPSFQNRNLFGGAELLTTSVRAGVEVNPSPSNNNPFFNTIDLAADATLNLPRFKDFGLYRFLNKLPAPYPGKLLGDGTLAALRERASTRFSIGYEYLLIRQLFAYTIFNARLGYDFRKSAQTTFRVNHLTIDVLDPTIEPDFQVVLTENPRLERSFGQQYFFSILFRSLDFARVGRVDRRGRSLSFNANFEVAGAEIYAANQLRNALAEDNVVWQPGANATFAKYVRWSSTARYNKAYTPRTSLAARVTFEIGRPFGGTEEELPYVKQFFVGGANSMRGWAPRGLGPGGFVDILSLDTGNNLFLYQTGDLRFEANVEYRFPLFSFFRGAFFVDAGNVWLIDEDKARPGAKFRFREEPLSNILAQPFYRQIAVNAGFGLRVDLSYFIFRLDFALPLRYNYPQDGRGGNLARDGVRFAESDYWRDFGAFRFRDLRPQLGLGYPF